MIDLRSDTLTQPTPGMRQAIANAVVGDEQKREDPTVLELEQRAAELLGQEEAVYLPTATMANQIALRVLTEPGDELLAEENAHIMLSRARRPGRPLGPRHARAARRPRQARRRADPRRRPLRRATCTSRATRVVVAREHAQRSGGRVWPLEEIDAVADDLPRARPQRPPRRRAAHERRGRLGRARGARSAATSTRSRSASRRGSAARSARSSRAPRSG